MNENSINNIELIDLKFINLECILGNTQIFGFSDSENRQITSHMSKKEFNINKEEKGKFTSNTLLTASDRKNKENFSKLSKLKNIENLNINKQDYCYIDSNLLNKNSQLKSEFFSPIKNSQQKNIKSLNLSKQTSFENIKFPHPNKDNNSNSFQELYDSNYLENCLRIDTQNNLFDSCLMDNIKEYLTDFLCNNHDFIEFLKIQLKLKLSKDLMKLYNFEILKSQPIENLKIK